MRVWTSTSSMLTCFLAMFSSPGQSLHAVSSEHHGWKHAWKLTLENTASLSLTDCQVALDLHEFDLDLGLFAPQGDDLRLRLVLEGEDLPHWIEFWDAGRDRARLWTRVPYIEAGSKETLYLLGGNPAAEDASDGFSVFHSFDRGDSTNLAEFTTGNATLTRSAETRQPEILGTYRLARLRPSSSNPVLAPADPPAWDDGAVRDPELLMDERGFLAMVDDHLVMYYTGGKAHTYQVGRAVSTDGVKWRRDPVEPVLRRGDPGTWDSSSLNVGSVLRLNDGTYLMYYSGYRSKSGRKHGVGVASSSDGVAWQRYAGNPVLTGGSFGGEGIFLPHTIRLDDGRFALMAEVGYKNSFMIVLATSNDGFTFTPMNGGRPVFRPQAGQWDGRCVANPKLIEVSPGAYLMGYNGCFLGYSYSIGFAWSLDLLNWTRYERNPVLLSGSSPGVWDTYRVEGPIVAKQDLDDPVVRMWYFGAPDSDQFSIGVATCDQDEPDPAFLTARSPVGHGAWVLECSLPSSFGVQVGVRSSRERSGDAALLLIPAILDISEPVDLETLDNREDERRFWIECLPGVPREGAMSFRIGHLDSIGNHIYWNESAWDSSGRWFSVAGECQVSVVQRGPTISAQITDGEGGSILSPPAEAHLNAITPFTRGRLMLVGEPSISTGSSNIDVLRVLVYKTAIVNPGIIFDGKLGGPGAAEGR